MDDATTTDRRRRLTALAFMALSLLTIAVVVSGALFTEDQAAGENIFTTGTVDISTSPATAVVALSGMVPGDSTVSPLDVHNAGTAQLRYSLRSTTTEGVLAAQLDLTIWDEAVEADTGVTCNATAPATVLYGPADLGSTVGVDVIGSPSQGSQSGDRVLAANAHHYLCFRVSLPLSTGDAYQGLTTTSTFDFHAEQTANN